MSRYIKNMIKGTVLGIHKLGLRVGLCILPTHYYSSASNILELEATKSTWIKRSEMPGIQMDLDKQVKDLKNICLPFQKEYAGNRVYLDSVKSKWGPGYSYIDAQVLHSVIRHLKPKKIIEVGSGVSTACSLAAMKLNSKKTHTKQEITCIEPNPSEHLKNSKEIKLINKRVQEIPFEFFEKLGEGDLLFIDSTHVVKTGSDVNYIILEILPRLKKGVIVHFHDIYFPYDYNRAVLKSFWAWNESSLLRAYLTFNNKVKILLCLSNLHYDCKNALKEVFPEYDPEYGVEGLCNEKCKAFEYPKKHFPASTYIQIL